LDNLNFFDVIVLALIVLLGLKGFFRGFIKEAFGLIGIVGGVFIASRLSKQVGDIVNGIIPIENESTIMLVGFVAALIAFWIVAYLLGIIVSKMSSLSGLGIFDRILGFTFGASKIFLIFSIIIFALSKIEAVNNKLQKKTAGSMMYPLLLSSGSYIIKIDTSNLVNQIENSMDKAAETANNVIKDISAQTIKEQAEETVKTLKEQLESK